MIKAIIFDLDNCLSAADAAGRQLLEPVFEAIRGTNAGTYSDADVAAVIDDLWRYPLDFVAEKYRFPPEMRSAAWAAYARAEVLSPMAGYSDITLLGELDVPRFLVTSGFRRLQESKIEALGIAPLFTEIFIDAIDEPNPRRKLGLFREITKKYAFHPSEVLVVGDNDDSEIQAGNHLGMTTVQTLRPGVESKNTADHVIESLTELKTIMENPNQ